MTALQLVLKKSLAGHGLARGLREACKVPSFSRRSVPSASEATLLRRLTAAPALPPQAIESRQAQLAVLAQDCDQQDYTKLIQALCTEANVNLITVPENKQLGEWVGLCKLDTEGKARKVVGCSCVVIKVSAQSAALLQWPPQARGQPTT